MENVCNFKFSSKRSSWFLISFWSVSTTAVTSSSVLKTHKGFWWPLISNKGGAHSKTTFTVEEINKIWKFCLRDRCGWQLSKWKFLFLLTCAKTFIFWGNQVGKASLEVSFSLQSPTLRFQETGISLGNHWDSLMLSKVHYWAFCFFSFIRL